MNYVYFCAQKSIIKTGNNKFQDLINAPRMGTHLKRFVEPLLMELPFGGASNGYSQLCFLDK